MKTPIDFEDLLAEERARLAAEFDARLKDLNERSQRENELLEIKVRQLESLATKREEFVHRLQGQLEAAKREDVQYQ